MKALRALHQVTSPGVNAFGPVAALAIAAAERLAADQRLLPATVALAALELAVAGLVLVEAGQAPRVGVDELDDPVGVGASGRDEQVLGVEPAADDQHRGLDVAQAVASASIYKRKQRAGGEGGKQVQRQLWEQYGSSMQLRRH